MIVCTGGAGFIGSNLVRKLNTKKIKNIIIVDQEHKKPPEDLIFKKFISRENFLKKLDNQKFLKKIKGIYHLGANSSTSGQDIKDYMINNFLYSKKLIQKCIQKNIKIIYASSASVYGIKKTNFKETSYPLNPENYYALSKAMVDYFVLNILKNKPNTKIIGLRYFNVYGPGENHKKKMASVVYNFYNQIKKNNTIRLFKGSDGFEDGEQRRDFVYIDDCIEVNLWLMRNFKPGIYNIGTGKAESFNKVANFIIEKTGNKKTKKKYITIPKSILNNYQSYTKANISKLKKIGYTSRFHSLKEGVTKYLMQMNKISKIKL